MTERALTKRYLLWLYKTTRDELDRVDRKFTQLSVDREIEAFLRKAGAPGVGAWSDYIAAKEREAQAAKFTPEGGVRDEHAFLKLKLEAIEKVTRRRFGPGALKEMRRLYEEQAVKNILSDTTGRR